MSNVNTVDEYEDPLVPWNSLILDKMMKFTQVSLWIVTFVDVISKKEFLVTKFVSTISVNTIYVSLSKGTQTES